MSVHDTERPTRYADVLAVRPFRMLFGAALLSITGISLQMLALSVLVYASTGSALLSAVAYGAGFLPQVMGGALLTSLADRLPPRRLVLIGFVVQAAVALVLGVSPLPPLGCVALVAAVACLQPVFSAAQGRLLPTLLRGDHYVLGRSLLTLASAGAQLAGLALSGVLIAVLGGHGALLVAAAGHLLAAVLVRAGVPDHRPPTAAAASWRWGDTHRSNVELLRDGQIRRLLLLWWLPPALVVGAEALVVAYVGEAGAAPGRAGWLLATMPAGMFVGEFVVGRFCRPATRERLVRPLIVLIGLPLLPFALYPPLPVAAAMLGFSGAGLAYQLGRQQAFLSAVPESLRGAGFGLLSTGLMTGQGLMPTITGTLAGFLGVGPAMAAAGLAVLATTLLVGTADSRRAGTGLS